MKIASFSRFCFSFLLVMVCVGEAHKTFAAGSDPDIAGISPGMSVQQVEAALKAYDASMVIKSQNSSYEYRVYGKRYQTDPFLIMMSGAVPGGSVNISVGFSMPPEPPHVVSVMRIHRQATAPLTQAAYVESLVEKYGDPSADNSRQAGAQMERVLEWAVKGGTVQCLASTAGPSPGNSLLARIQKDGKRMADPTPEYTQNCATILRYTLRGDPVTHAVGLLFDVADEAKSEFQSQAWLQQLIDEKSRTGTEKPKL